MNKSGGHKIKLSSEEKTLLNLKYLRHLSPTIQSSDLLNVRNAGLTITSPFFGNVRRMRVLG